MKIRKADVLRHITYTPASCGPAVKSYRLERIMKKFFIITVLLVCFIIPVHSTEQIPDVLYYKDIKLDLRTGWGHPSPLELYYSQNNIDYPFDWTSTANYRGHVAVWVIHEKKLYLKEIQVNEKKYQPKEFNVLSQKNTLKDAVFADWFSGIIESYLVNKNWKVEARYYFHVRYGKIVNTQTLTDKDYKRIRNLSEKNNSDEKLLAKVLIDQLNENYIAYYFRLYGDESIKLQDKDGYLRNKNGFSPILAYYSNDHMKWPYNWENIENCGAPNCKWVIENQKLYLTEINLHSGLNFESIDITKIELSCIFNKKVESNRVFADWISGVFLIQFGEEVEDKEFKVKETTFFRIENGIIKEMHTVSGDLLNSIPDNSSPRLKKMINDYENQ